MNGKKRQGQTRQEIYDYIVRYTREHLYSPSIQEIKDELGITSTSTVKIHLTNLDRDGLIIYDGGRQMTLVGFVIRSPYD